MQVLIEDGQDVADEKLEFLIDSTSRQIGTNGVGVVVNLN